MPRRRIAQTHYELLAALRHALRRFLVFSQDAARGAGLTPQQHQALLAIKGFPGRDQASIGELAERLQLRHHSAVGLVDRLARRGLLRRMPSRLDRRRVEVRLTSRGEAVLERLSAAHLRELGQLGPELHRLIGTIIRGEFGQLAVPLEKKSVPGRKSPAQPSARVPLHLYGQNPPRHHRRRKSS
jgi:DNA-binding MarR family transcriptional regulator